MKPKFKGSELTLAKMLLKTVFMLNGETFPENVSLTRGTDTICATYETATSLEQCFINLNKQTVTKSYYNRINLLKPRSENANQTVQETEPLQSTPENVTEITTVQAPATEESDNNVPVPLPIEPIESAHDIPENCGEEKSEAERLLPEAIKTVEERVDLIRKISPYSEPSDLYINPDGSICYPNNVESDCIGHAFDPSMCEEDKDELLDLLYGELKNVEVYEPSDVLVIHM